MSNELRCWMQLCEAVMPPDDVPPNPQGMMDAFYNAFDASGLADQVTVSLMLDPDSPDTTVELNHISTKPGSRGGGLATKVMGLLTDCADQYNVVLRLGVASDADGRDGSMTGEQLEDWYAGWGFEGGHVMRRSPDEPR
jgi:hypothetical protein